MIRRVALAVSALVAAALLAAAPVRAQSVPGADYDTIVERGWILLGVYEDFPPYSFTEGGKLTGIDVDLGREIAAALGVEARFRAVGADENVDDDLRNNVWKGHYLGGEVVNVMMHMPYNKELEIRNEFVVLTGQYFNERIGLAWRRDVYPDGAPSPAYFRYDKVGVEIDSLADFYLASQFGGQIVPNMTHYPSVAAAVAGLAAGEVGAVMAPAGQLEYGIRGAAELTSDTPPLPGLSLGEWTLGVAVRHTYRQLGYAVDDAIRAAVEDGRLAEIFARYGVKYRPPVW